MGATVDLTTDDFESTVTGDGTVIVDFWASWCGPCRSFAPVFDEVAATTPDVIFAKVDTEAEPAISADLEIRSIPTLMAFRDGVLVFRQSGALPKDALEQLVTQVQGLDMDQVRAEMDSHEHSESCSH